jgi:Arc/MetJ-type ribon-helix-helix transcriptional regulator
MAKKLSISVRDERQDVLDWIDKKVEDGVFQSRSHAFVRCAMIVKEEDGRDVIA